MPHTPTVAISIADLSKFRQKLGLWVKRRTNWAQVRTENWKQLASLENCFLLVEILDGIYDASFESEYGLLYCA